MSVFKTSVLSGAKTAANYKCYYVLRGCPSQFHILRLNLVFISLLTVSIIGLYKYVSLAFLTSSNCFTTRVQK